MTTHTIREAIEQLHHSFYSFKQANDQRLQTLEKKNNVDPLLEQKVDKLNQEIDKALVRLKSVQTASLRPDVPSPLETNQEFWAYVRKGQNLALEQKSLHSTGEEGGHAGYLVPQVLSTRILEAIQKKASMRSIARTICISSNALDLLLEHGQTEVGWVAETAQRPETSTKTFEKKRIPLYWIYASPKASQEILEDSAINLEEWFENKVAERIAEVENQAFIYGDGNGKPRGFLNVERAENEAEGKIQQFTTERLNVDTLMILFHSLKPRYLSGAVWVMGRQALAEIRKIKDPDTGHYVWQPNLTDRAPGTLFGYPIALMDEMPNLTGENPTPIAFGNFFEGYQIVGRSNDEIGILRDPYTQNPFVIFRMTKRVGGDVVNSDAIKLLQIRA